MNHGELEENKKCFSEVDMTFWVISIFDPTVIDKTRPMRFAGLSITANKRGHQVLAFSNTFRHSTKSYRFTQKTQIESHSGIKNIFINSTPYKRNHSFARFYSHFVYFINFRKHIQQIKEYPEVVISALPPIWLNYYLSRWCSKRGITYVVDIIDPWPDVFLEYLPDFFKKFKGLLSCFLIFHNLLLKESLKKARGVVAISETYLNWSLTKCKKIKHKRVFYPGVETISYLRCKEMKILPRKSPKIRVVYAGNLGLAYNIPSIISAIHIVNSKMLETFEFCFAGRGIYEDMIRECSETYTNIKYFGQLDWDDLLKLYSTCDIGLAQYHENATQSITYKLFDYTAAGLVVLNSLQTEMGRLITEYDVGINNLPGDYETLAENLISLTNLEKLEKYQNNAFAMASKLGDNNTIYNEYVDFLVSLQNVS